MSDYDDYEDDYEYDEDDNISIDDVRNNFV